MPLCLQTAAALVPGHRNPNALDDELLEFYGDLLAPYRVPLRADLAHRGRNISFAELAAGVLDIAPPASVPDLVIVAYGLPDLHPLKTVSSYVNHLLGGGAYSFAVSEQGLGAPFTALRIADAYARSGRCRGLALFVLEQTTLPYWEPFVHERDLVDSGVVLFFGERGGAALAGLHSAPPAAGVAEVLRPALAGAGDALLVAGPGTDPAAVAATGVPCHRVAAGSYCTSVWLDLARHHTAWTARYDTVVLCDTDPRTGWNQAAVLRTRKDAT